jgi:lycopene cyclase domain-containing protein
MKEYTILAMIFVLIAVYLDRASRVNLLRKKEYYLFIIVILFFKILVNGYLTGNKIVVYSERFFLGLRLGSIPLEDFLFGFSMVTMTIIFWERFKKEGAC